MKIRNKLLLIPAVGFGFLLVLFVTIYLGLAEQKTQLNDIYDNHFGAFRSGAELSQGILAFHSDLYKGLAWVSAGYDRGKIGQLQAAGKTSIAAISRDLSTAAGSTALDPIQKDLYAKASLEIVDYMDWAGRVNDIVESDMAIANMFLGTAEDKMTELTKTIFALQETQKKSSDEAYQAATRSLAGTIRAIIIVFLLSVGSTIAVSLLLNRRIMRSINSMTVRAADISKGTGDLTQKIQVDSRDEIGRLCSHLNEFMGKIEGVIAHIKEESGKAREIGSSLSRIATDTSADTVEISMTVNSSKDSIQKLDEEIQSSVGIINEIAKRIDDMAKSMEGESSAVTQSSASIEQIDASINTITAIVERQKQLSDRLSLTAAEGLQKMEESSEAMARVYQSTGTIVEMVDVINGITGNLDLLGMNAAIEAAQAGSAGKGFAVVAEEVGRMAEQTAANAATISETLVATVDGIRATSELNAVARDAFADLVRGIQDIVKAMEETRRGMNEITEGSGEIVKSISSLLDVTSKNRALSSDINENTSLIGSRMTKVSELSCQVAGSMGEISSAVVHVSEIMTKLSDVGRTNAESIMSIDRELGKFKVGDCGAAPG
jgi:methyl-accepting chemotaxis protein